MDMVDMGDAGADDFLGRFLRTGFESSPVSSLILVCQLFTLVEKSSSSLATRDVRRLGASPSARRIVTVVTVAAAGGVNTLSASSSGMDARRFFDEF
jgi:hypothetical protein